jgi:hypothetical protein
MSTDLTKTQQAGALAVPQNLADLFGQHANAGMEAMTQDDFALPFLRIVQSLSPERKRTDAKYIDGAEEGIVFNTVTRRLYTDLTVIPVFYDTCFLEWKPRAVGGGFVAKYDTKEDAIASMIDGNDLQDVSNVYVLVREPEGWSPAVLSFKKGARNTAKAWNSKMRMARMRRADGTQFTPPIFSKQYRITTVERSNDQGTWFTFKVDLEGATLIEDLETFASAKAFHESLQKGAVGVDYSKDAGEPAAGTDEDDDEPKM